MDRLACVNVDEFPLQILLRRRPEWASGAVAVVHDDRPGGQVLWVNEHARTVGILPGMTYARALSAESTLQAAVVPPEQIEDGVREIAALLRQFAPEIEASEDEPGVFWLQASGLKRLFRSASQWTWGIKDALRSLGFRAAVVLGYRRFAVYAIAKARPDVVVLRNERHENEAMRDVALNRLGMDPKARDKLEQLGVYNIGDLVKLAPSSLRRRFGEETARLHDLATGRLNEPWRPSVPDEPIRAVLQFEPPEEDAERLLFTLKTHLHPILRELANAVLALARLEIRLQPERRPSQILPPRVDEIRPSEATLDERVLMDLIRLRFEGEPLRHAVEEVTLIAFDAPADQKQLRLFFEGPRRDLDAANRALARIRTELGPDAVVHAVLQDGHLPEAGFRWERLDKLAYPNASEAIKPRLIRTMHAKPKPLPTQRRHDTATDGWMVAGPAAGPVVRSHGPYLVSGGWWRKEVRRRYFYVETQRGQWHWIFYDERRRRWFEQGRVE